VIPSQFYPRKENKLPQVFSIEQIKQLLTVIPNLKYRMVEQYGKDTTLCPKCGKGKLELIAIAYGSTRRPVMVQLAAGPVEQNREGPS
jgi:hypothetical protein